MVSSRARAAAGLIILILLTLGVPVVIPIANALRAQRQLPPTYLPALEGLASGRGSKRPVCRTCGI